MLSGEIRQVFILILIERAWIIVAVHFFHGPLQNTHHSSIRVAHVHSFISVGGRKLYYLDFMDWKSMDHCQRKA